VCGEELEASTPRCRNPRLIIYNVPDEVNIENAKELIMKQNSELCIEKEDITPRFLFKDKRKANNLVTEVNSKMRMKFLGKKMKLGWNMCNVDDYIKINKCYKCSKLSRLRWAGHVTCQDDDLSRRVLLSEPGGKRPRRRPRLRWEDGVEEDVARLGCINWKIVALNWERWRKVSKEAEAHHSL